MIIVRLADGALWINSPVVVPAETLAEIKALGPLRFLIAPTKLHVWWLEAWRRLFPEAELWAPPQVPRSLRHLPFTGILGDEPRAGWAHDLDQLVFRGNLFIEEVCFLHRSSRTLIVGDFIQNYRPRKWLRNLLTRLAGVAWPHGGVPIDIRLSFLNRKAARESRRKLLAWDFDKLILAHGECVETGAKEFVRRAFRWLE
jgi:glyoxylase-like metal-dependent hydrolase (beta-lactamase superfamily II)